MANALTSLRETAPKPGANKYGNTLRGLMQRYDVGNRAVPPQNQLASIGTVRQPSMRGGIRADGGRDAPPGMSSEEAANAATVGNAENAPEVAGMSMSMAPGIMGGIATLGAQGLTSGLKNAFGPYGVVGLGKAGIAPQPGTPAFAQSTPADDVAEGYTDTGAVAAASSNLPGPVASGMGAFPGATPAPNMRGGVPGFTDAVGNFMDSAGISFGSSQQEADDMFAEAMGEVASGRRGGDRGTNAGIGGGRGVGGGLGGGVGDVGAGNPGGTGVL